jgi:hypothetical protein
VIQKLIIIIKIKYIYNNSEANTKLNSCNTARAKSLLVCVLIFWLTQCGSMTTRNQKTKTKVKNKKKKKEKRRNLTSSHNLSSFIIYLV